jgi:hypothetical protein
MHKAHHLHLRIAFLTWGNGSAEKEREKEINKYYITTAVSVRNTNYLVQLTPSRAKAYRMFKGSTSN